MKEAKLLELKPMTIGRLRELRKKAEAREDAELSEALDEVERLSWENEMGEK